MSFDIQRVDPAHSSARVNAVSNVNPASPVLGADAPDDAVEVETMPLSPPPEVIHAIGVAAAAYDRLQGSGQQLHFGVDPGTGRLSAHLQDLNGTQLSSVSPSAVLAIAGGQTP